MIDPGLCARCVHSRVVSGARSQFWMCEAAKDDPRLRRYPPLPVLACPAYQDNRGINSTEDGRPDR